MFFLFLIHGSCWWGHAHSMIAGIAMDQLTHSEKAHFQRFISSYGFPDQSAEAAASWHDSLKGSHRLGIMSGWHFIPQPLCKENYDCSPKALTYNITSYLQSGWNTLMNPTTKDPAMIAFHLRSLMHFVGDVHTPHHNVAYYSAETPRGDMGGNLYPIVCKHGSACINIHFIWDAVCFELPLSDPLVPKHIGDFQKNVSYYTNKYPMKDFGDLASVNITSWMLESFDLVKEYGYMIPMNSEPTESYLQVCRGVAIKRVLQAGYRLGKMLRTLIDKGIIGKPETNGLEIFVWVLNCVLLTLTLVFLILGRKHNLSNGVLFAALQ